MVEAMAPAKRGITRDYPPFPSNITREDPPITRDCPPFPSNITREDPPIYKGFPFPSLLILQGRTLARLGAVEQRLHHEAVRHEGLRRRDGMRHEAGRLATRPARARALPGRIHPSPPPAPPPAVAQGCPGWRFTRPQRQPDLGTGPGGHFVCLFVKRGPTPVVSLAALSFLFSFSFFLSFFVFCSFYDSCVVSSGCPCYPRCGHHCPPSILCCS